MAANYLHGVETIEITKGARPVRVVKSAVVALTGIAPKGLKNELTLVLNETDAAQFGSPLTGFNIPQALAAIFKQGSATVLVVNVYDEATHSAQVTNEEQTVTNGRIALQYNPVDQPVLTSKPVTEVRATATFTITGGTSGAGNQVTQLTAGATTLLGSPVAWATSNNSTAAAVAAEINTGTGSHGYSATASGAVVTVSAPVGQGATANTRALTATLGGNVTGTNGIFANGVTAVILVTYVKDTDYRIDDFGNVAVLNFNAIAEGSIIRATYKRLNGSLVQNSDLIGSVNSSTQARTGTKLFDLAYNSFGITPKLFIIPKYSTVNAIATAMIALADKFRGFALIDAPIGTSPSQAITGRGPLGNINFNTSSKRAVLCYPHVKEFDVATNANINAPYSQYLAGVICNVDLNEGYWISPSNHEIKGIVGIERAISFAVNDASTEANALNEVGIVTLANSFGTGTRTWGNRSAAFPTSTFPTNFICVQRTADILHESLELAMLQFIDKPIVQATLDSIRDTVNAFIRTLIARGALVDGKCIYNPAKNPPTELAAGHLTFDIEFMPPTPAERITFESFIDINLLQTLK